MVRRPTRPAQDTVRIDRVNIMPVELELFHTFPLRATMASNFQPMVGLLMGYHNAGTRLVNCSEFNELLVAQGGSGLDNITMQQGSMPASYNPSDLIAVGAGMKRFDVLVRGQTAEIQITKLDGNLESDIILEPGRYSFDFDCLSVQIRYETTSGGTYQLVGYYTSQLITQT